MSESVRESVIAGQKEVSVDTGDTHKAAVEGGPKGGSAG